MSGTIENRVVQLEFEHKEFEKSIGKSIDALDEFDERLGDFASSVDNIDKHFSFKGLQNAIDSVNFDGISESTQSAEGSFDSLEGRLNEFSKNVKEVDKGTNFDTIQKSINNLNFRVPTNGLQDLLASVHEFVEQVKIGFEREIGAGLANKLKSIIKSLSVDQINEGFAKYTSSTKDIVAIMNQADMSMEEVEARVAKLSWYSDATSYSYSAMVQALKNFVAQGIDMDTAIAMIMGMGNSLSYAGLAAEEASSAFTVYSKAMGQGYVSLTQWKSLNLMSASTKKLKQQFIDAAVELGKLKKVGEDAYKVVGSGLDVSISTFESTLSAQGGKWLDTDVLQAIFSVDYGDYVNQLYEFSKANGYLTLSIEDQMSKFDQSTKGVDEFGKKSFLAAQQARTLSEAVNAVKDAASTLWKDVFTQVFGNAVEATEMWGNFSGWLYDIFIPPLIQISNLLKIWKDAGGRDELLKLFSNLSGILTSIVSPIKSAYTAIFGPLSELDLVRPTNALRVFAGSLILSSESSEHLGHIFEIVFGILEQGMRFVRTLGDMFGRLIRTLMPLIDIVLAVADYLITIFSGLLHLEDIMNLVGVAAYKLGNFFISLKKTLSGWADKVNEIVENNMEPALDFIELLRAELKNLFDFIKNMFSSWSNFTSVISSGFETLKTALTFDNILATMNDFSTWWYEIGWNAIVGFKDGLVEGFKGVINWITTTFSSIIDTVKAIFDVHSPSVVFFEIGAMLIAGLLLGIGLGKKDVADSFSAILGEAVTRISENLTTILTAIGSFISGLVSTIIGFMPMISTFITNTIDTIAGYVLFAIGQLLDLVVKYVPMFANRVIQAVEELWKGLQPVITRIGEFIKGALSQVGGWIYTAITTIISQIDAGLKAISDFIQNDVSILDTLATIFDTIIDRITEFLTRVLNSASTGIGTVFKSISDSITGMVENILNAILSVVNAIAAAIPDLAAAVTNLIVTLVNEITKGMPFVLGALSDLLITVSTWLKSTGGELFLEAVGNFIDVAFKFARIRLLNSITKLFNGGADILGSGSSLLGGIKKSITKFFTGLTENFKPSAFTNALKAIGEGIKSFSKEAPSKVIKAMAIALLAIAVSLKIMETIEYDKLYTGFALISGMILELILAVTGFDKLDMDGVSKVILTMTAMIAVIVLAILALSKSIEKGNDISAATVAISSIFLGFMGVLQKFGELKKAGNITNKDVYAFDKVLSTIGGVLLKMSTALVVFAIAAKIMDGIDSGGVGKAIGALASMVAAIALLAATIKIAKLDTGSGETLESIGVALIAVAGAVAIFAIAAKLMDETNISIAVAALAALVLSISFLAVVLGKFETVDIAAASSALLSMSAALLIMAIACAAFNIVKPSSLLKAAGAIVIMLGVVAALSAASGFFSKGIDLVEGFAKAMLLFSAAVLGVSLALTLLVVTLSLLSVIGTAAITAAVAALDVLLIGLLGLSDTLVMLVSMIIEVIMTALLNQADTIITTVMTIFMKLVTAVMTMAPILVITLDTIGKMLITLIMSLLTFAADQILSFIEHVLVEILDLLVRVLENDVFGGLIHVLETIRDGLITFLLESVEAILVGIEKLIDMIDYHLNNVILPRLSETVSNIINTILQGAVDIIVGFVDSLYQAFIDLFNGLADVVRNRGSELNDAIFNLIEAIFESFDDLFAKAAEVGRNILSGLIEGLADLPLIRQLREGALGLWNTIKGVFDKKAEIASPSKAMYRDGAYIVMGLAKGIEENTSDAEDAAEKLAQSVLDASEIAKDTDFDNTFTITPILDLSQVQNGASSISDLLSGTSLSANVAGFSGNIYRPELDLLDELRQIKFTMPEETTPIDSGTLVDAFRSALSDVGVYMDRNKVGKLLTIYQSNVSRANGV